MNEKQHKKKHRQDGGMSGKDSNREPHDYGMLTNRPGYSILGVL
jgi:hypothetical protein